MLIERSFNVGSKIFKAKFDPDEMKRIALGYQGWTDESIKEQGLRLDDKTPTAIELEACVKRMLEDIDKLEHSYDHIMSIAEHLGKKKDGYFRKGATYYWTTYPETGYTIEECYGDNYLTIKAKAEDASKFNIILKEDIFKW